MIRLDKYLTECGLGTRSQVREYLKKGRIRCNGMVIKAPDQKLDPNRETLTFDDQPLLYQEWEYLMLNKPAGCVTAVQDSRHKTVMDCLSGRHRPDLSPVGRLDLDTEGLLLLTNDGALTHHLLSPSHHVDKTYFARIDAPVTEEDAAAFAEGVDIGENEKTLPARLEILPSPTEYIVHLTIREGKFHQVKRMFEARGKKVLFLKRTAMGPLTLDPALAPGEFRPLTKEEIDLLRDSSHRK